MASIKNLNMLAKVSASAAALTVLLALALLILSPEYNPSWRLISEYAAGSYGWVLGLLFTAWAVSSCALAYVLRPHIKTRGGKIGLVVLWVAGLGEVLSAVFNIFSPVHDLTSMLAILGLPIAAILITKSLFKNKAWSGQQAGIRAAMHFTWISLVLQIVTFGIMAGTAMSSGAAIPEDRVLPVGATLPEGTIALVGWANRLLVVAYCWWVGVVAVRALKIK